MSMIRKYCLGLSLAAVALTTQFAYAAINIIPLPQTVVEGAGTLSLGAADNVTLFFDAGSDSTVPWVEKLFSQAKIPTTKTSVEAGAKFTIKLQPDAALGAEGYKLNITATGIAISAPTLTGQFYAVQSLRQLFPAIIEDSSSNIQLPVALPIVAITDKPRLEYRGSMVDPVRRFIPLPALYQHIDRMALYKLNNLHLLLSNDQGFRIESKVFPRLNEFGSKTQVGGLVPPGNYGTEKLGYYTQNEMRAFVKYAALRKIKVIPEIDAPGHCGAIIAAMDSSGKTLNEGALALNSPLGILLTKKGDISGFDTYKVFTNNIRSNTAVRVSFFHMASGTDRTNALNFLRTLWTEMTTVFPSDVYQMGGDEATEDQSATYTPDHVSFTQEVQNILKSLGKKTTAWDEVKKAGGLLDGNWSQDWHASANNGDIASNCNAFYFDHYQKGPEANQPPSLDWCKWEDGSGGERIVDLYDTYKFHIEPSLKGVEGILFGEFVITTNDFDLKMWPRITAVAEIGWAASNNTLPGFEGFKMRLGPHGARFSAMGINYHKSTAFTNLNWQTAALSPTPRNLFSGFVPTAGSTSVREKNLSMKGFESSLHTSNYNIMGRKIKFSGSGHPEAMIFIKNKVLNFNQK